MPKQIQKYKRFIGRNAYERKRGGSCRREEDLSEHDKRTTTVIEKGKGEIR